MFMDTSQAKKPEDIIEYWAESFNSGNLKAILDLYDDESVLLPTFLPGILSTKVQIKNYFERAIKATVGVEIDRSQTIVKKISKNNYALSGSYVFVINKEDNIKHNSRFTFLVDMLSQSPIKHHHSSRVPFELALS